MRVAKRFRWEGAHRLADHPGLCRTLHGHSYELTVEVDGAVADGAMVIDFHALRRVMKPLVDAFDHAVLVHEGDAELLAIVRQTGWRHVVLPFPTTSEAVALVAADVFCRAGADLLRAAGATTVAVRLQETETCYAVYERPVEADPHTPAAALDALVALGTAPPSPLC